MQQPSSCTAVLENKSIQIVNNTEPCMVSSRLDNPVMSSDTSESVTYLHTCFLRRIPLDLSYRVDIIFNLTPIKMRL